MANVPLSDFLPGIRPAVPGCPENVIEKACLDACIRLCTDSWVLRQDIDPGDITAGVNDYRIIPDLYSRMIAIEAILYDGTELPIKTEEELDILDPEWRKESDGTPTCAVMREPDRIRLNRVPEETIAGGFIPRIVIKPSEDAPYVDERLFNDWRKAIEYGATSYLLEIPGKKWTDLKTSEWFGRKFNFMIQRAKDRSAMGYSRKSTTAQPKKWI